MPALRQFFASKLSIIDRYILRDIVINLIAVTGVLWLIYVATRFARYLAQAAVGNLPGEVIFTLLGYSSLGALTILLPIGAFLAVLLTFGRMNSDNEMTVIAACGISPKQILRNVLIFSGVVGVIVVFLSTLVVPEVLAGRYELEQKAKVAATTSGLVAGTFKESKNGGWTFYASDISGDNQEMENIFIEIKRRDNKPLIFRSETGYFEIDPDTGDKFLVLNNGYRYQGEAGQLEFTIAKFASHSLLIEKGEQTQIREKHKSMSTWALWQRGTPRDIAEIQWRLATSIMTVVLCLIAVSLARTGPRQGRFAGFFPAVLVYIIYSNLLGLNRAWIAKGVLSPWIGAIWVHLLMIGVLLLLMNKQKILQQWRQYQLQKGWSS